MEVFVGAVAAFLIEVVVIAGVVAPRWTLSTLRRLLAGPRPRLRISLKGAHASHVLGG
jgi:hypothetical protein